ncbi:hypothetical protein BS47DRAFT_230198 [Hydnum rufescens UP504]|uniref:Uncharacterized protein n=1 Tax=Hydnum rufescens UP504 TaxID=1448309 RepID=A0A9P6AMW1_9AGAM|nr:hypothetical protein BS47DRAFT_230198 [Hydnum rufescens UP504]
MRSKKVFRVPRGGGTYVPGFDHVHPLAWKTGTLKTQNLSATNYGQFYQGHINWIQEWRKKPVRSEEWKDVSKDLGSAAAVACGHAPDATDLASQFVVFDTD